jgi:hypothetical protein
MRNLTGGVSAEVTSRHLLFCRLLEFNSWRSSWRMFQSDQAAGFGPRLFAMLSNGLTTPLPYQLARLVQQAGDVCSRESLVIRTSLWIASTCQIDAGNDAALSCLQDGAACSRVSLRIAHPLPKS